MTQGISEEQLEELYKSKTGKPNGQQPQPQQQAGPSPQGQSETKKHQSGQPKQESMKAPLWLMLLQVMVALLTIWLIWQSVEVYVSLGREIGANWIVSTGDKWAPWLHKGVVGFLFKPIEWLLQGGSILVCVIGMLLLYITLQIFEVAPLLLENNPRALRRMIGAIAQQKRLELNANDPRIIQVLKEKHNAIPQKWVRGIYTAKWIAYGIDLLICLYACPPIKGGWGKLELVMSAPSFNDFDIGNVWKILVTLFAVEVGFFVYMWIKSGQMLFAEPKQQARG